ncbi:MAG: 4Fe-4S binding protein [Thermoleophilia bacterium]|nr:4Fe-4S binding protein [Thermoleophilia bacterium]
MVASDSRSGGHDEIFPTEACWSDASGELLCLDTGSWRTERPVIDKEKCNACGFCFIYCPTQCVKDDTDGIHFAVDLRYCKGCGICARECPKGAITMVPEGDYADECPA